jgi:copper chaperone
MTKLNVPDMSCGHCRATIETAVTVADPLADLTFDMEARTVEVETDIAPEALMALMKEAGFPATLA